MKRADPAVTIESKQQELLKFLDQCPPSIIRWQRIIGAWIDHNGSREAADDRAIVLLLAEEIGEVVQAFRTGEGLGEELADVIMLALHIGHRAGIEVQDSLLAKMKRNVTLWAPWKHKGRDF